MQNPKDNPRVVMLKKKLQSEFFDLLYSLEYNLEERNLKWFDCMRETLKELCESITSVKNANEGRQNLNLLEMIAQRNKLNRKISTLKKETLKK